MNIKVLYFASLQESAKKSEEFIDCECNNSKELFDILNDKYNFDVCIDDLKIAINEKYSSFETVLKDGDIVVFIPPIAGG